jgi:hypothetical protein
MNIYFWKKENKKTKGNRRQKKETKVVEQE